MHFIKKKEMHETNAGDKSSVKALCVAITEPQNVNGRDLVVFLLSSIRVLSNVCEEGDSNDIESGYIYWCICIFLRVYVDMVDTLYNISPMRCVHVIINLCPVPARF